MHATAPSPARPGRHPAAAVVHYGNLAVPATAAGDFDRAVAYLGHDSVERDLFARLERGAQHFTLVPNARNEDFYDPNTHTIHWDPHSALQTTQGGYQSPAMGLGHEVDHAVENEPTAQRLANTFDSRYDNKEERRVITGSERHAATTLHEDPRSDHGGSTYRVASPDSR